MLKKNKKDHGLWLWLWFVVWFLHRKIRLTQLWVELSWVVATIVLTVLELVGIYKYRGREIGNLEDFTTK